MEHEAEIRVEEGGAFIGKAVVRVDDGERIAGDVKKESRDAPKWRDDEDSRKGDTSVIRGCGEDCSVSAEYGVHVFQRNGGMARLSRELKESVTIKTVAKDYSQVVFPQSRTMA